MSRIAKMPIGIPSNVNVLINGQEVEVKGAKGSISLTMHPSVKLSQEDGELRLIPQTEAIEHRAMAGTMRSLINNMVTGVNRGFEKRLQLVGVGYRGPNSRFST